MISSCLFCTASSCSLRPCSSSSSYLLICSHILHLFHILIFCSYSAQAAPRTLVEYFLHICIYLKHFIYFTYFALFHILHCSSSSSYPGIDALMPKFGLGAKFPFPRYIYLVNVLSFCFNLSLRLSMVACMSR